MIQSKIGLCQDLTYGCIPPIAGLSFINRIRLYHNNRRKNGTTSTYWRGGQFVKGTNR